MTGYKGTGWLWWTALLIAAGASLLVYYIKQDPDNINTGETVSTIIMFAVIGIGLCVISATAHWWIHR